MKIASACENLERKKNIPDSYFLSKTSKIRSVKKLRKKKIVENRVQKYTVYCRFPFGKQCELHQSPYVQ